MNKRILILLVIAGLAVGFLLAPKTARELTLETGTLLTPAREVASFQLLDQSNQAFGNDQLRGKYSLLFFGFTSCPDVCPTTLATLARAHAQLARDDLQVVFISVDPETDTPAVITQYLALFDSTFIGLSGERDAINALSKNIGISHMRMATGDDDGYTMNHTSSVILLDRQGAMRAVFSAPIGATTLAADLNNIFNHSS